MSQFWMEIESFPINTVNAKYWKPAQKLKLN